MGFQIITYKDILKPSSKAVYFLLVLFPCSCLQFAPKDGPFVWDENIQQLTISSLYWGCLALQIPGGRWAEAYGAKKVFLGGVLGTALCTLLVPISAYLSWGALVVVRISMGLFQVIYALNRCIH
jgi:MFS family permease